MKRLTVLCFLLCTGCSRYTGSHLGKLFDEAQESLAHGDLPRALLLSERGQQFSLYSGNSEQLWKFRCIRSEAFGAQRDWRRAAAVLSDRLPAELAASQVAARVEIDRGAAQTWLGNSSRAQEYFDSAAALCRIPANGRLLGELKLRLAGFAFRQGAADQAASLAHEAVTFARQNDQPYLDANAMTFLGALLMNEGRWGQAVSWLQPATDAARRLSIKTSLEKNLGNLAWCYYNLGDDEAALAGFVEAERDAGEISNLDDRRRWLTNIGSIYENRDDDYSKAAGFYLRALNIARQINQPDAIATDLHNLAVDAFNHEDFETAKKYNDEEMRLKRQRGNRASELYGRYLEGHIQRSQNNHPAALAIFEEIVKESGNNLSLRWQSQVWCARVHEADHQPELAQRDFNAALETFHLAHQQAGQDEFKITLRSALNRYYSDYIHFLMHQGKPLEALNIAETSRAQVLSERLGVESNIGFTLARVQATAAALQAVILSYWLTPEGSYLWVITPTNFATLPLPPGPVISKLAESYQRTIASSSKVADTRLYKTLVAPAQQYIPRNGRVIVIPDSNLYQINFETLLVPSEPESHYWIEDAVVSTATSLALLSARPRPGGRGNVLLIGNPVSPVPEFPPLPYAEAELHSIADRFPVAQRTVYEGAQARPSAYLAANPGAYSWIHFAAHGVASKESPLDSAIVLSNEGDSFKLYARDIAKLPLKADLVTISACYGSGTRTFAGEGIVGLAWAFLLAGAHNVVASLWEANDYYTAQLMDGLYVRLQSGDDAAHALRTAKLSLLHSEYVCRNPRYWGAFQLYTGY